MALTDQSLGNQVGELAGISACTDAFFNKDNKGAQKLIEPLAEMGMDLEAVVTFLREWTYGATIEKRTGISNYAKTQELLLKAVVDGNVPIETKQRYTEHLVTDPVLVTQNPTQMISFEAGYAKNIKAQIENTLNEPTYEVARGRAA